MYFFRFIYIIVRFVIRLVLVRRKAAKQATDYLHNILHILFDYFYGTLFLLDHLNYVMYYLHNKLWVARPRGSPKIAWSFTVTMPF